MAPSPPLVRVASSFVLLQESRHEADYDLARVLSRSETMTLISEAERAFENWTALCGTEEADTFLVALLVRGRN